MSVSPFEVERQEFGRGMVGYRRKEVDNFLDEIQRTIASLWQERADLREENERLNERVARFTALEEQLKNTLLLAQDSAEKACEQAKRESDLLMREAGQKAREIVHAAHEERQRLEQALRELQSVEQEARGRFRALAQTVIAHLDDTERASTNNRKGHTLRNAVKQQSRYSRQSVRQEIDRPETPLSSRNEGDTAKAGASAGVTGGKATFGSAVATDIKQTPFTNQRTKE